MSVVQFVCLRQGHAPVCADRSGGKLRPRQRKELHARAQGAQELLSASPRRPEMGFWDIELVKSAFTST